MRRWATAQAHRPAAAPPPAWAEALAVGVPLVVLAALSLYRLDALSLWRDEVASVVFAGGSLPDLLTIVGRDRDAVGLANMATYYVGLHFWLALGDGEWWLRLPSVAFGVATVVPVYAIGRRLGGWTTGALAAAIFVLVPFVIHYNQEVRGYSLSMLVAAGLTWLLLVGVERRDRAWPWLAYGVIAALGIYVHFFVALVVAAHGLWVLVTRRVPAWPAAVAALVPIALAAVPIPLIIAEFGGEQEWIPPLTAAVAAAELADLGGGPWPLLALAVGLGVALVARHADERTWLLAACVLVPILGAVVISLAKPMFVGRYLILVLPAAAVLAAVAVLSLPARPLRAVAAIGLVLLLAVSVPRAYADPHQQDWRALGAWMADRTRPGDRMIAANARRPIEYYLRQSGATTVPIPTRSLVARDDAGTERVWVALTGSVDDDAITARLAEAFVVAEDRLFGARLRVVLMTRAGASDGQG